MLRIIGRIKIKDELYHRGASGRSQEGQETSRKELVKVVLSKQQREILRRIAEKLGQSESEVLRMAFLQYAEKLSLITEKVHS